MTTTIGIGEAARQTGLSVKAIRFYESDGYIPPAGRSESGYRRYSAADVHRLRLIKQMRTLGMPLVSIRRLLEEATDADCDRFAVELQIVFRRQMEEIRRRIAELEELRSELESLADHVDHCQCDPGRAVEDCGYCLAWEEVNC
jgi:MerR family transcriptional regulator, copper efflux regulator